MKAILYEGQKHTINEMQRYLGYEHCYLYRIARNEKKIRCMDIDKLKEVASLEMLEPEELRGKMLEYARKQREE